MSALNRKSTKRLAETQGMGFGVDSCAYAITKALVNTQPQGWSHNPEGRT